MHSLKSIIIYFYCPRTRTWRNDHGHEVHHPQKKNIENFYSTFFKDYIKQLNYFKWTQFRVRTKHLKFSAEQNIKNTPHRIDEARIYCLLLVKRCLFYGEMWEWFHLLGLTFSKVDVKNFALDWKSFKDWSGAEKNVRVAIVFISKMVDSCPYFLVPL